ncbi:MAG: GNAT family N-acetyltransferase, partial [Nanoarchaeota archaeon]|nr:GNAT family N-acetyltransferase [Nanoarchaeota archaeon]
TFWKSMVFNFAVRADYRGHGIGTRLVEEAKKRIANSGADSIEIYIDADHLKARSFFLDNFERVVEKPYKKLFLPLD